MKTWAIGTIGLVLAAWTPAVASELGGEGAIPTAWEVAKVESVLERARELLAQGEELRRVAEDELASGHSLAAREHYLMRQAALREAVELLRDARRSAGEMANSVDEALEEAKTRFGENGEILTLLSLQ
jgi:hypothetical protein